MVATAEGYAFPGKVSSVAMPVISPSCLTGGIASAAMIGGVNSFVGSGKNTTIYSLLDTVVVGGDKAVMKSPKSAEVFGGLEAFVTSLRNITIDAKGMALDM